MSDLIERLGELKAKASKTDWEIRFGGKEDDAGFCIASRTGNNVVCERWPALGATEYNYHDPQLILTLVNNLDTILTALQAQKTLRGIEEPNE